MPRAAKAAAPAEPEVEPLPDPSVWVFTHYDTLTYPEARDAAGRVIGTVEPGDCRVLTVAPDEKWRLATQAETGAWIEHSDDVEGLAQLGIERTPASNSDSTPPSGDPTGDGEPGDNPTNS